MLFGIVAALSIAIILVLAGSILGISEIRAGRTERTLDGLKRIEDALIQFVAVNGRLPCPANGALDTGIENPSDPNPQIGAATCTTLVGTVPWQTLGISQDFALDAWAQKISYRVFHGPTGLTQSGGASMTDCDLFDTGLSIPLPANKLCDPSHDNTAEQFLFGKGLSFDDKGTTTSSVAFVLISHGPTGRGAFLPGGVQTPLPNAANGPERGNAANDTLNAAQRTFFARGFSDSSVSPDDPIHFDDLTRFIRIDDLARKAGRGPRDWPDAADEVGFDETTTKDMTTPGTGHFLATGIAGQVFARGSSADIVTLGSGSSGLFGACLWWPSPLTLYIPPTSGPPPVLETRKSFRMAVDFSFPDTSVTSAAGLVVGFISGKATPPPDIYTCGTNSGDPAVILGDLGWGGLIRNDGITVTPITNDRFGVEIDIKAQTTPPYTDPSNNHVAIDTFNTYHASTVGPVCPGPDCTTAWLRDGTDKYHRLRIELEPRSVACGGDITGAPQLRLWIMPYSVCTLNPEACLAMRLQDFSFVLPPGTLYTQTCLTPPPSGDVDAYDSIYFGFTSAKDAEAGLPQTILNLKQLQSGVY